MKKIYVVYASMGFGRSIISSDLLFFEKQEDAKKWVIAQPDLITTYRVEERPLYESLEEV